MNQTDSMLDPTGKPPQWQLPKFPARRRYLHFPRALGQQLQGTPCDRHLLVGRGLRGRDRRSSMKTIAASLSRPGATTRFSTIRMTKDRADDASPAVRDAMLAAVPGLHAFAISLSGKVDRADDLVQETLLRAIANINSFHPGSHMSAWLFAILRNLFRTEYRKRRREVEDAAGSYAESLKSHPNQHSRVELEEFRVALAKLPSDQREALACRRRVGLLLRGGGCDLQERGRHDQEPGQSRAHAALEAALHRQRRQVRPGSHDACRSDRGRARLI
jgi:RNA polymerase sigma factor (sigma-70 family)